ncbi:MAG: HpaII family restriction endonuclease [Flavobacteriales bacterium]
MIKGNKGEWSEIYTLFKLLGDKQLFLGNKDIEKLEGIVYPIIRVLRTENENKFEYSIQDEIILISGGEKVLEVPIEEFKQKATFLLESIKANKKGTFALPEIEDFMNSINCFSLKAGSTEKKDITIVVHDQRTNQQPTLGFSIKSQLGRPATLLNAGKTTNFIYKLNGNIKPEMVKNINSMVIRKGSKEITDLKGRLNKIVANNCTLHFIKNERLIFSNNLVLIDSLLPEILANMVYEFYTSSERTIPDLIEKININNPLNFNITNHHKFYEYKIKRFLTDIALGMMPSKVWSGQYDATGGYLIVKDSGDVLCYHIYNKNEFENYLFNNTRFEKASASKFDYGTIYNENGELFFKLNLQIRFIK